MGTANRWTSQNGQQEGRNLNVNDKYTIRREKREKTIRSPKKEKKYLKRNNPLGKMRNTHQPPQQTRSKLTGMYQAHHNSMVGQKCSI